jgi:hypothetical protein
MDIFFILLYSLLYNHVTLTIHGEGISVISKTRINNYEIWGVNIICENKIVCLLLYGFSRKLYSYLLVYGIEIS